MLSDHQIRLLWRKQQLAGTSPMGQTQHLFCSYLDIRRTLSLLSRRFAQLLGQFRVYRDELIILTIVVIFSVLLQTTVLAIRDL